MLFKFGLVCIEGDGVVIVVEVWEMLLCQFGGFVVVILVLLGIGMVELVDGSSVKGFICELVGIVGVIDIIYYGGWVNYFYLLN